MTAAGTEEAAAGAEARLLAPYLPRLSIEWLASASRTTYRVEDGTVVFVDISGFTKLSEGLARHGKVGAEELTATIGSCFVALLDQAVAFGGRLLKFGGDALLLYFTGHAHAERGCRAAVEMRRTLRTVGKLTVLGQKISLRMSVGVHSGEFHFFLVGSSHRELVVTGPGASTVVTMEGTANAGQIVVSPATASALRPGIVGHPAGSGFLLRRAPQVPDSSFVPFEPIPADVDIVTGIPVALRDTLLAGQQEPEHRRVTVAFVHFDGTDALVADRGVVEAADQLDELMQVVQVAADRNQVTFLATDVDHDGGKVILTAGAPSTFGDDEHRMLLTVREVMDADTRLSVRIGVNRGAVFAGEIGPPYRRTFTVMGDAVNLAARLMAKAVPGQLVVSPDVLQRSRSSYATEALEPFFVKGKAKPVRAFVVGEVTGDRVATGTDRVAFVGRTEELTSLRSWADAATGGRGLMVEIIGDAGVGKTRLVDEMRATLTDLPHLSVACQVYDASTPYLVVRRLLRQLLGLAPSGSDPSIVAAFVDTVARVAPDVLPWAPLVGQAVGLELPDTEETADLDEEYRRPRLARAVVSLLAGVLPPSGLLCVEDAHFMDEASADLFGHLADVAHLSSWLTLVSRRPVGTGFVAPDESAAHLAVEPLSGGDAADLAREASAQFPLTSRQIGAIVERSGGNPLFLLELVAATSSGEIGELPDTIDEVVAARIDNLPRDSRFHLRRLAVLGQSFRLDLAAEVVDGLPRPSEPEWAPLDEFLERGADGMVGFRNSLVRDSAYDGLSFRQRRLLHDVAADAILRRSTASGDDQPELLSFHYLHAQRFDDAWHHALRAADRATSVHANFEAAEFFERAIVAGRRSEQVATGELTRVQEALGDARSRTGSYARAAAAYRSARRSLRDDPVAEARLILKLAKVEGWLDRYATALRWITKALGLLDGLDGRDAGRLRADLLSWYGRFCQESGHHTRSIEWCRRAIAEAEASGEEVALAEALRVLDWAMMELGRPDEPVNAERALVIYERLGDLHGQANATNLLGMSAYWRGDWSAALDYYLRCLAIDQRTGNPVNVAFQQYNIGEIALDRGLLDEAEQRFVEARREWLGAAYRSGVAAASVMLARVAAARGLFEESRRLNEEAIAEFQAIGSHAEALEARARLAESLLLAGELDGALAEADAAIAHARTLGGVSAQLPLLHRVRGAGLIRMGRDQAAREALDQSLEAARSRGAAHEVALTLQVLGALAARSGDAGARGFLEESERVRRQLGIVWTPDLIGGPVRLSD